MLTGVMSFAFVSYDGSFPFLLQGLIPNKHFAPQILSQHLLLAHFTGDKWAVRNHWGSYHRNNVLGLPEQNSTHWVASTTHLCGHTVLEARRPKSRCRQSWFLLRAVRTGSVLGLSLLCGWLFLPVSLHTILPPCLSVSVSQYLKEHKKHH